MPVGALTRAALTPHLPARRWVPGTAKFVALGSYARGTGTLQVYELDGASLQRLSEAEKLGFSEMYISQFNARGLDLARYGIRAQPVGRLDEVLSGLFG